MSDPGYRRTLFREIMSNHYKNERDRSEKCLGEIITILGDKDCTDPVEAILDRLVKHYQR